LIVFQLAEFYYIETYGEICEICSSLKLLNKSFFEINNIV